MDRNQKFLKRLSEKERNDILSVLLLIQSKKTASLDLKKLSGHQDIFRVRVGNIRIIFLANRNTTEVLEISHRSEKTYRNF